MHIIHKCIVNDVNLIYFFVLEKSGTDTGKSLKKNSDTFFILSIDSKVLKSRKSVNNQNRIKLIYVSCVYLEVGGGTNPSYGKIKHNIFT